MKVYIWLAELRTCRPRRKDGYNVAQFSCDHVFQLHLLRLELYLWNVRPSWVNFGSVGARPRAGISNLAKFKFPHIACLSLLITTMPSEGQQPWHSAFPTPSFDSKRISAAELVTIMKEKVSGEDYIIVDVRRTDFEVRDDLETQGQW
jgi:hypothetical protein